MRGTIAMAKLGSNANSATSQFFFNTANNSGNLDVQNGGFTVFGQVIGDGMDVVDAISDLNRFAFSNTFSEIPLRDYTADDINDNVTPTDSHLVIISDIVVIDATVVTNPSLVPTPNTLINNVTVPDLSSGGGGSISFGLLAGLLLITFRKRVKK